MNSALQRAHAILSRHELDSLAPPEGEVQHGLVSSFLAAFEADDIAGLTALSRREGARSACAS